MAFSEVIGGRHIRFTRTVRAEIGDQSVVADIWLECVFPPDFKPELYSLGLKAKEDGGTTVELTPPFGPDVKIHVLDAGATRVAFGAEPTSTSFLDLAAEQEAALSDERGQQIRLEMARLQANPDLAEEKSGKAALLAGAAAKPLRRI